jgi:hypothetical protein
MHFHCRHCAARNFQEGDTHSCWRMRQELARQRTEVSKEEMTVSATNHHFISSTAIWEMGGIGWMIEPPKRTDQSRADAVASPEHTYPPTRSMQTH